MDNLNDYEFIDKENMFQEIVNFPSMIKKAIGLEVPLDVDLMPKNIIVAGMGASGISGDILKNYLSNAKIMVDVVKDYDVPNYVNNESLVFVMSYSGNTEEAIEFYRQASSKGAKVIVITSGGKIETVAKIKNEKIIKVPAGHQPRAAVPFMFFTMLNTLIQNKIIGDKATEIQSVINVVSKNWYQENAKKMALKLRGRTPIIYTSKNLASAGMRFKTQINENSKTHCFFNVFSELNHNEIVGYSKLNTKYHVIMLIDEDDSPKIRKRMDLTKDLIASPDVEVTQIRIKGDEKLTRIFSAIYFGDWISFFLAVLNDVDPSPVDVIQKLKSQL